MQRGVCACRLIKATKWSWNAGDACVGGSGVKALSAGRSAALQPPPGPPPPFKKFIFNFCFFWDFAEGGGGGLGGRGSRGEERRRDGGCSWLR